MDTQQFEELEDMIKMMWIRAAQCFEVFFDAKCGWGLRVKHSYVDKLCVIELF
jgi:hypothetical protein